MSFFFPWLYQLNLQYNSGIFIDQVITKQTETLISGFQVFPNHIRPLGPKLMVTRCNGFWALYYQDCRVGESFLRGPHWCLGNRDTSYWLCCMTWWSHNEKNSLWWAQIAALDLLPRGDANKRHVVADLGECKTISNSFNTALIGQGDVWNNQNPIATNQYSPFTHLTLANSIIIDWAGLPSFTYLHYLFNKPEKILFI